jgi:cell division septation protein DedD
MKNLNLVPHSSSSVKAGHGNKSFVFVSIFLLILLSFVCLYLYIPSDIQWQGDFGTKIGSFFNIKEPRKLIKLSENKKNSEVKKHFELLADRQEYVDNVDISNEIEEKTISVKGEEKVASVEIEKEQSLAKVESKHEGLEIEKTKQVEIALKKDSHYYIQVCSCVIKENADKIFRKLGDHGYSPFMEEIVRHVKMHNVYTEAFTKKSDALELLNRLKNDGFDSVLLPSSGSGYKIRITSCFYMESAKGIIERLNSLGYKISIRKEFIPTRMYSVLLGNFESLEEAEAASERLIKLGYPQPILKRNPKT